MENILRQKRIILEKISKNMEKLNLPDQLDNVNLDQAASVFFQSIWYFFSLTKKYMV